MDIELVKLLIIGVLVFTVAIYIFGTTLRIALVAIVVVLIFRMGWVYTGDDIQGQEFWNKILPENVVEFIVEKYDEFSDRRDEGAIIDAENLEDGVKKEFIDKTNEFIDRTQDTLNDLVDEPDESDVNTEEPDTTEGSSTQGE